MSACASARRDHFRHQQLSATSEIRKDEFSSTQGRKKKKLLPPAENMRVNGGSPDALLASLVLALALMQALCGVGCSSTAAQMLLPLHPQLSVAACPSCWMLHARAGHVRSHLQGRE